MSSKKIYLISPREPSGATWLINCFLELGIKTYRSAQNNKEMWINNKSHCVLSNHEEILKKWLPALWSHQKFKFCDDIEVEWSHTWPTKKHDNYKVLFFTRDPRDSLFSRYKREKPSQTFEEFISFPDINSLLDKTHNWRLFSQAWMQHPNIKIFRFEDYKKDSKTLLMSILNFLELIYSDVDVSHAISASTFQMAVVAEDKYRNLHPEDQELINRSGKAGEWKQSGISSQVLTYIEDVCCDAMLLQGYIYEPYKRNPKEYNYLNLVKKNLFFKTKKLPFNLYQKANGVDLLNNVIKFSNKLDLKSLQRARLRQHEVVLLLDNLIKVFKANKLKPKTNFNSFYRDFGVYSSELGVLQKLRYKIKMYFERVKKMFSFFGNIIL